MIVYRFRLRRILGILVQDCGSRHLPPFLALAGSIAKQDEFAADFICKLEFKQYFEPGNANIP
jgi:hypothetical protein